MHAFEEKPNLVARVEKVIVSDMIIVACSELRLGRTFIRLEYGWTILK
jgi:hypothetical protein